MILDNSKLDKVILNALEEDMPYGDITTDNLIPDDEVINGRFISKDIGVIAGIMAAVRTFELIDKRVSIDVVKYDSEHIVKGDIIAYIQGPARAILKGERTALNLLQRLSGIATATNELVSLTKAYNVRVTDTRKTTPGLRYLEKYAVAAGGGANHRFCLSDGVMIKDNHIASAGSITKAVTVLRSKIPHTAKIEVETENMDMVKEALTAGADIIMLDNMSCEAMKEAVEYIGGRALTEASGNVTRERIVSIAQTGVDIISVGSITHSVKALDISLRFQ